MNRDLERQRLILFADARGFTGAEAVAYLSTNGYEMTRQAYWAALERLRKNTRKRMTEAALNFDAEHLKRLDTLATIEKELWEIVHTSQSSYAKVKACETLMNLQDRISAYNEATAMVMEEAARVQKLTLSQT